MSQYRGNIEIIEISEPTVTLPFCEDVTGKKMRLVQFINTSKIFRQQIIVEKVDMRFGVPPQGFFCCVMCEDAFVQTIPMLKLNQHKAIIRDGHTYYEFTEEGYSKHDDRESLISSDALEIDYEGNVLVGEYRFPFGTQGNPLVYVQNDIGIDTEGMPMFRRNEGHDWNKECRIISAINYASLSIREDRQMIRNGLPILKRQKAVKILEDWHGWIVALFENGEVKVSKSGKRWSKLAEHIISVSTYDDMLAVADKYGSIYIYKSDKKVWHECKKLHYENSYISEIAICGEKLALKFADCTFDIINWETNTSCIRGIIRLIKTNLRADSGQGGVDMPRKASELMKNIPEYDYTDDETFVKLASECARGDADSMALLGNYFEDLATKYKDFRLVRMAQYWKFLYFIYSGMADEKWLVEWDTVYPIEPMEDDMVNRRSVKGVNGTVLRYMGYLSFIEDVSYDIDLTKYDSLVRVCRYPYDGPSFESGLWEYTLYDKWLNPLPIESVYFHPDHKPSEEILEETMQPLVKKALKKVGHRRMELLND